MHATVPALLLAWCALAPDRAAAGPQAGEPARVERRVAAMGTLLALQVDHGTRAEALAASEAALRAVEAAEARLSNWRADSELARLNATPPGELFRPGPKLWAELELCRALHAETAGAFDPGVGTLVRALGLRAEPADPALLAAARGVGLGELEWGPDGVRRRHALLDIDSGGFGKGAALDDALALLRAAGAHAAVLDFGGQIAFFAQAPRSFALAHPRDRARAVVEVELDGGSLSTSGTSEHGAHLLDPRSGASAPDFGSLSVWSSSATRADALSTALFVMGPEAALAWAARQRDVELVVLDDRDGKLTVRASAGLQGRLRVLAADVQLEVHRSGPTRGT